MECRIEVPANYLPDRKIDCRAELLQCVGNELTIRCGGLWNRTLVLPSPPAGFFAVLEMIDSPFFLNPWDADCLSAATALYLLTRCSGKKVLQLVDRPERLKKKARKFLFRYRLWSWDATILKKVIDHCLSLPFEGYAMIPNSSQQATGEWLFGADFLAAIVNLACKRMMIPANTAIWNTPLCLIGHVAACAATEAGTKHVERQKDRSAIKKELAEATKREMAGILHPWQIQDPEFHAPTALQAAKRPEVVKEWQELLNKKNRKGEKAENGES